MDELLLEGGVGVGAEARRRGSQMSTEVEDDNTRCRKGRVNSAFEMFFETILVFLRQPHTSGRFDSVMGTKSAQNQDIEQSRKKRRRQN